MEGFMNRIKSIINTIMEIDQILIKEITSPSAPKEGDNVFHVNTQTLVEFQRTEKQEVKLPELIQLYEKWTDSLWELCQMNIGHYSNKKIVEHVLLHRKMVETFGEFFESPTG
jgi:hypothetical protein